MSENTGLFINGIAGSPIWTMADGEKEAPIGIRFDCGDSGAVYVSVDQARDLANQLRRISDSLSPSSVVEALPTEDEALALLMRQLREGQKLHNPSDIYQLTPEQMDLLLDAVDTDELLQAYGRARKALAVQHSQLTTLRAEKAELSRQLEEARLRITNLETGRSRKRNQIKVLRGKLASLKHRNWLDGIPRVTHSDAKWKLLNTGLKLRAEAAEAKLAEATRELEQLKLERGREVHPAD